MRGTGGRLDEIAPRVFRITAVLADYDKDPLTQPDRPATGVAEEGYIVVSASKQSTKLVRYPGSVHILDLQNENPSQSAANGSSALAARLPVLTSTGLGTGREKLFIRGVADSSFSGPTQATIVQYLGDARLKSLIRN